MKQPDVDTLIAYAKGALAPEEARRIERFLEVNYEARRLIEDFRRSKALTRPVLDQPIREAPPRRPGAAATRAPGSAGAGRMAPPVAPAAAPARRSRATTLAASLMILAGLGVGGFLLTQHQQGPGQSEESLAQSEDGPAQNEEMPIQNEESLIAPGRLSSIDALSAALTRLPSGTPDMAGDRAITVLATFRDGARRACREFEVSDTAPTASRIVAVACQDGGAWRIEGSAWLMADGAGGSAEPAPAAGSAGPLKSLLARLGAGGALDQQEEAGLIARNWQEKTSE